MTHPLTDKEKFQISKEQHRDIHMSIADLKARVEALEKKVWKLPEGFGLGGSDAKN